MFTERSVRLHPYLRVKLLFFKKLNLFHWPLTRKSKEHFVLQFHNKFEMMIEDGCKKEDWLISGHVKYCHHLREID
nr:hypothetical protein [Tanacetum cinerariifolium]